MTRYRLALAAAVPVAVVAVIAGIISYSHIVALGVRTGQSPADAHLLPLAVDGLIVAGSVILAAGSWLGWLGVVPGVAATLFANLESGLPHGYLGATVATWPAVAFTVATFMVERWLRTPARPRIAEADLAPVPAVPGPVPESPEPDASPAGLAAGVDRLTEWFTTGNAPVPAIPEGLNGYGHQAAGEFADEIQAGQIPGIRAIRDRLHVGQPKATQVQAYLRSLTLTP